MWRKKYHKFQIKFIFSSKIVLKIIPALLIMFITFNFFVPTLLEIVFLVKVGSSTPLAEPFSNKLFTLFASLGLFTWLVFRSHRLHAYSIFESKQAILITLFGWCLNEK